MNQKTQEEIQNLKQDQYEQENREKIGCDYCVGDFEAPCDGCIHNK